MVAAAFNTSLVCMPMILIFGQMRGAYLGGSLLTFFLGYCILFFKSGFLLSAYPFSAALILAGFDMQEYNGATQAPSVLLAVAGIAAVLVLTMAILLLSRPSKKAGNTKKKKSQKGSRQASRLTKGESSCENQTIQVKSAFFFVRFFVSSACLDAQRSCSRWQTVRMPC